MDNLKIYNLMREVPETAKTEIQGGRMKGKTDINPMWRIKMLTEQFGPCGIGWYYKTIKQWTEVCGEETAAFVNIELYIKHEGEWSQPIFGTGGSMFAEKEKSGIHVSDECFKMATTDAISVSCKQLGIGADVYWQRDHTKYGEQHTDSPNPQFKEIERELIRTGYSEKSICATYKVKTITDLTELQIKDFLQKIKSVPSKAAS